MRVRGLLLVMFVAAASVAGIGRTQSKPDFSGTWTFDPKRSTKTETRMSTSTANPTGTPVAVELTPVLGQDVVLRQDQKTLVVWKTITPTTGPASTVNGARTDRHEPIRPVTYRIDYPLDGSETRNIIPQRILSTSAPETVSTAAWNGARLVMTIRPATTRAPGPAQRVFRLEPDGALAIDVTTPLSNGGLEDKTTHVYRRKSAATDVKALKAAASLAGSWLLDHERTSRPQIMNPLLGDECVISQDQTALIIRGTISQMPPRSQPRADPLVDPFPSGTPAKFEARYPFDGASARNKVPAPFQDEPEVETVSVANWDQAGLVLTTFWSSRANSNSQRVFHVEPDGSLVIDVVTAVQGPAPSNAKYFYTRKAGGPAAVR